MSTRRWICYVRGKAILSFHHDENLQQAPFDNIRLFESRLFPVCANNGRGEPRYTLEQPHFPLLNYSQNSYMGRLINRTRLAMLN